MKKPALSRTIWFDVTDLIGWTGHLTGIQRTAYHLGREFAQQENVKFFRFDEKLGFVEASFPLISPPSQTRGTDISKKPRNNDDFARSFGLMKRLIKAIYRRLIPAGLQKRVTQVRSFGATVLFQFTEKRAERSTAHPFNNGDSVLLLGAVWGSKQLNSALYAVRRETKIRLITTVYDLIPVKFPQFFGPGFGQHFSNFLVDAMCRSDALLSISASTTNDIRTFERELLLPCTPVIQFRLGDDPHDLNQPETPVDRLDARGFILAVGTVEIRKNYRALYQVWAAAFDRGVKLPKLVIVGGAGWLVSDLLYEIQTDPRIGSNIEVMQGVDDATLSWLYRNCLFTVYPSWYEGWGLPIAESLSYGKLCIASKSSSMPEIAGDLNEYCSPDDSQEFFEKIRYFVENTEALNNREIQIRNQYLTTTWEDSFKMLWSQLSEWNTDE